jgi:hypothetical protein
VSFSEELRCRLARGHDLFAGFSGSMTSRLRSFLPHVEQRRYRMRTPGHGIFVQVTVSRTPRQPEQNNPRGFWLVEVGTVTPGLAELGFLGCVRRRPEGGRR